MHCRFYEIVKVDPCVDPLLQFAAERPAPLRLRDVNITPFPVRKVIITDSKMDSLSLSVTERPVPLMDVNIMPFQVPAC